LFTIWITDLLHYTAHKNSKHTLCPSFFHCTCKYISENVNVSILFLKCNMMIKIKVVVSILALVRILLIQVVVEVVVVVVLLVVLFYSCFLSILLCRNGCFCRLLNWLKVLVIFFFWYCDQESYCCLLWTSAVAIRRCGGILRVCYS
jgi:hypothetical protein